MLKVLQFGTTGQVARALLGLGPAAGVAIRGLSCGEADLAEPQTCAAAIAAAGRIDAVINAAAYTAVDLAEQQEALAHRVNGDAPGAMARACAARGIPFLHISTDYVFDGRAARPYREDDATAPLGAYGRSKLAGEHAVLAAGGVPVILRTSWVFSPHGRNFVRTMLRLAESHPELSVVDDQQGGPTEAGDIAATLLSIAGACAARQGEPGIFHYSGTPVTTWRRFAEVVFAQALPPERRPHVRAIRTEEYPTPAVRPANSALACDNIKRAFGIAQPCWRTALARVIGQLETAEEGTAHA